MQNDGRIVYDRASGLMWQQSGSDQYMKHEESMSSLMESSMENRGLYIDSVFDSNQSWIWTSDQDGASRAYEMHNYREKLLDNTIMRIYTIEYVGCL